MHEVTENRKNTIQLSQGWDEECTIKHQILRYYSPMLFHHQAELQIISSEIGHLPQGSYMKTLLRIRTADPGNVHDNYNMEIYLSCLEQITN